MDNKKLRMIRAVSVAALATGLMIQAAPSDIRAVAFQYIKGQPEQVEPAKQETASDIHLPIAGSINAESTAFRESLYNASLKICEANTDVTEQGNPESEAELQEEKEIADAVTMDEFQPLPVNASSDMQKMIYDTAQEYGLDWTLVMALIQKESNFDPTAISKSGDYGLMQINKVAQKRLREELGTTDFLNPAQNVKAGCYILSDLMQKYGYENLALMAYNCGEGGAKELWEKGIWSTEYSRKIIKTQDDIKREAEII